jgi:hypothetical protein
MMPNQEKSFDVTKSTSSMSTSKRGEQEILHQVAFSISPELTFIATSSFVCYLSQHFSNVTRLTYEQNHACFTFWLNNI